MYNNLSIIVAFSKNGVIGQNNQLPWHIPEDLAFFKNKTKNSILIMGRNTFESLPKRPLSHRYHIILSSQPCPETYKNNDSIIFVTYPELLVFLKTHQTEDMYVIGGNQVYELLLPLCSKLYITQIQETVVGNVFFPFSVTQLLQSYALVYESEKKTHTQYSYIFTEWHALQPS
jgi:dihydrofolate reductase